MNKAFLSLFSILCLSLVLVVIPLGIPASANPDIIKVGFPGEGFATIQSAINASKHPGDIILVNNGTYSERVSVDKPVSLVGVDRDTTIIDAGGGGSGISITASNVLIQGFTITKGGSEPFDAGITVSSGNNVISHNRITNNGWDGIDVAIGAGNLITDNTVSSNSNYGIAIYATGNNMITNNVISSNSNYGIYLYISASNTIYHNNLINALQASSDFNNTWNYDGEGNYWSDYKGQDQNGDGIGDVPYFVGAYKDNYPLMGMFSQFDVNTRVGTFDVAVISNSIVSDFSFEIGAETGNRIIHYKATGNNVTLAFSRIKIPVALMNDPFVVIVDEQEIAAKMLPSSNATFTYLYFTHTQSAQTVTIFTSDVLHLYKELLAAHLKLQSDLNNLNTSYRDLLNENNMILNNYTGLQQDYQDLSNSYQSHLKDDANVSHNLRSLTYIIVAMVAIFIITTIYLSRGVPVSGQKSGQKSQLRSLIKAIAFLD